MKVNLIILCFCCIALVGCIGKQSLKDAHNPNASAEDIKIWKNAIGLWKGSSIIENGDKYEWLIERDEYGKFLLDGTIIHLDGTTTKQIEVGEWGIDGYIYFVSPKGTIENGTFYPFNEIHPASYQAYEIVESTKDSFTVKLISSGDTFKVERVQSTSQDET